MEDKRGGKREGAGRKSKTEEEKIVNYALSAMVSAFGSEEKAWESLGKQAKESFPHLKLLFEYKYGSPKQKIEHDGSVNIPMAQWLGND